MTNLAQSYQQPKRSTIDILNGQEIYQNPRKAATKAKEAEYNLEMMRRRLMVLQGQEEYNRFRTIDQQKRINRHNQLHQKILREKKSLRKSLQKVNDNSWMKQKCQQIRQELKLKVKEARKNLIEEKTDRTHHINEESIEHDQKIKEGILRAYEENKLKKMLVQEQESSKRQVVSRHANDKIKRIKMNKSIDSSTLIKKACQGEDQMSRLVAYQQELLKKNSQSLQASQLVSRRYNEMFTTSNTSRNSSHLPQIKSRVNSSRLANNSQTQ